MLYIQNLNYNRLNLTISYVTIPQDNTSSIGKITKAHFIFFLEKLIPC